MENRNILKAKTGSTLIWALIMMMVLGILITGGLAIAASYSNRSVDTHVQKQSYYTALSATKAVAEWFTGTTQEEPTKYEEQLQFINMLEKAEGSPVQVNSTVDESRLGSCDTEVTLDPDTNYITILSSASYNGEESTVKCVLASNENSVGGTGDGGGDGNLSAAGAQIKLITTPGESTVAEDPDETQIEKELKEGTAVEEYRQRNLINRNLVMDFSKSTSYTIANNISKYSYSGYGNQYYGMNISSNDSNKNIFVRLSNGNFKSFDIANLEQDRGMVVYNGDTSLTAQTSGLVMYTDAKKNPPRKDIVIAPNLTTNISGTKNELAFKNQNITELRNTHIQIDDTGETAGEASKSVLYILNGINFSGNSSIYTRRDTFINYTQGSASTKGDESRLVNTQNSNTFSLDKSSKYATVSSGSVTINGKLIIADGSTKFKTNAAVSDYPYPDGTIARKDAAVTVNGDIIIGGQTDTKAARLDITNGTIIKNGNVYVRDGGTLNLHTWNCDIYNTVFVEPGGTVIIGGTKKHNPIYLLPGYNKDGVGATAEVVYGGEFKEYSDGMKLMDDTPIQGKVYAGGEGVTVNFAGSIYTGGMGNLHAVEGTNLTGNYDNRALCVKGKMCTHEIKIPEYGNVVSDWKVLGYSEN